MADYQPLIAKAVAGLEKSTGEARRSLYERARTALVTQLRGVVPALNESDITRERLALEEAIRKVEAEAARKSRFDPPPERRRVEADDLFKPKPDPAENEEAGPAEEEEKPESTLTGTAADLRRSSRKSSDDRRSPDERVSLSNEGLKGFRDVVAEAESLGDATAQAGKNARAAYAAVPSPSPEFDRLEPRMESDALRARDRRGPPARDRERDQNRDRDRDQRRDSGGRREPPQMRELSREPPQGREPPRETTPPRERARDRTAREAPRAPAPPPDEMPQSEAPRRDDWSMRGFEPEERADDMEIAPPPRKARRADPEPPEDEGAPELPLRSRRRYVVMAALAVLLLAVVGVAAWQWRPMVEAMRGAVSPFRGPEQVTPREAAPARQKDAARLGSDSAQRPATQATADVAQRVVLYEEDPNDPAGKKFVGSSVWRVDTVATAANQPPETVIRADIEIPERKMTMKWSLRRNTDKTLPASHTVEIMFTLPPDFSHGSVQNIPGILMKQEETTRGVPLAGLAVKVTTGFFLIGLSAVESDMQRNIALLKERTWFDVPIVYTDGRRAILAVEKGTPGDRAFNTAFTTWKQ